MYSIVYKQFYYVLLKGSGLELKISYQDNKLMK